MSDGIQKARKADSDTISLPSKPTGVIVPVRESDGPEIPALGPDLNVTMTELDTELVKTSGFERVVAPVQGFMAGLASRGKARAEKKEQERALETARLLREAETRDLLQRNPAAGTIQVNPKDGAEMVCVPAGPFLMGDDDQYDNPRRTVTLDIFWIYKTPVTVGQYRKFCQAVGREMAPAPSWGWKDDHPVVNVSWHDAKAYCDWAGAALPTEAQWEKAARGTDGRKYPWGNDWDPGRLQCSKKEGGDAGSTARVGSFPAGASPYGCLDMAGNVWEWCADWYDASYRNSVNNNPQGPASGAPRVLRGGSRYFGSTEFFRGAYRGNLKPVDRNYFNGFRAARSK